MASKHILIVSRTIIPNKAPRATRATELAKEFARKGHRVTLYAVLGNYDYREFESTHNIKVKDIGKMRFATLNSDGKRRNGILDRILGKALHKLLEFPDIELVSKVRRLILKEEKADLLITVAFPFPLHWGAAWAKSRDAERFPHCWVADCGDPYMGNPILKKPFYFRYIEKWFCRQADFLSVPLAEAIPAYYPEFHQKIRIIPQGFDFDIPIERQEPVNKVPTFIYAGVFYKNIRDPRPLLDYLATKKENFKFIIFTKSRALIEDYVSKLAGKLEIREYIPREKLLNVMSAADFLINLENNSGMQSPSKLIDYALASRPILSVNSSALNTTRIDEFLQGDYSGRTEVKDIDQYDIRNVAESFLALAEEKAALLERNSSSGEL